MLGCHGGVDLSCVDVVGGLEEGDELGGDGGVDVVVDLCNGILDLVVDLREEGVELRRDDGVESAGDDGVKLGIEHGIDLAAELRVLVGILCLTLGSLGGRDGLTSRHDWSSGVGGQTRQNCAWIRRILGSVCCISRTSL